MSGLWMVSSGEGLQGRAGTRMRDRMESSSDARLQAAARGGGQAGQRGWRAVDTPGQGDASPCRRDAGRRFSLSVNLPRTSRSP